jgi:hypothetical protein
MAQDLAREIISQSLPADRKSASYLELLLTEGVGEHVVTVSAPFEKGHRVFKVQFPGRPDNVVLTYFAENIEGAASGICAFLRNWDNNTDEFDNGQVVFHWSASANNTYLADFYLNAKNEFDVMVQNVVTMLKTLVAECCEVAGNDMETMGLDIPHRPRNMDND